MFHFECKYGWKNHKLLSRAHLNTGVGATALLYASQNCDEERGVSKPANSTEPTEPYSPAFHRALLSLWSACSHRSFDSLTDKFNQAEIDYLRPGTKLPSSVTLSRDIKLIHTQYVPIIREYFKTFSRSLVQFTLLLMDGQAQHPNLTLSLFAFHRHILGLILQRRLHLAYNDMVLKIAFLQHVLIMLATIPHLFRILNS
ncbi:unnamed protein product [Rhizoctonia solani]|nr:unnamed protein product [Rhizoctonia solani]